MGHCRHSDADLTKFADRPGGGGRGGGGCTQAVELAGVAPRQQLHIGFKGRAHIGQAAVFLVQRPGAHAGQQRALQRHTAVASVGGVEIDEAVAAQLITVGCELGLADHQQHLVGIGFEFVVTLLVKPHTQVTRLLQHRLRRHAPFIGRVHAFTGAAVPPVVLLHALQVFTRQLGPGLALVQCQLGVQQVSLQLQEARHLGHQLPRLLVAQRAAKTRQRVAEGVVARQHLHRRPGAAVGRAQHQQARAFALHQAVESLGPFQQHGAGDDAAHAVGDDAHRLARAVAGVQRGVHRVSQAAGFFFDGAAPVEGEGNDLVGLRKVVHQVVIDQADGAVGLDVVCISRLVLELGQATDQPQAEPDAFFLELQVAAQDARQHKDRGLFADGPAVRRAAPCRPDAAGILPRPRQRADGAKARRRRLRQAAHHGLHGAFIGKVVEVRGLAALVQQEAGTAHARAAAVHAARLHDDVVVGPVVGVGQQRLQPAADAVALQVAGHHAQVAGNGLLNAVEPVHQRRVGDHAGQAGQLGGVGAAARDFGEKVHQRRHHGHAGKFNRPLQHRQVGVQPLAGQQRAARRAGDAHDAVHHDALGAHGGGQVLQFLALRRVLGAGEEVEVLLTDGTAGHQRQHLGHQAAA